MRHARSRTFSLLAVHGLFAAACSPSEPAPSPWSERDSAGIRIVESGWAPGRMAEGWSVGPEPTLSIGVLEGDAARQFDGVAGAALLSDGRIAVVDAGSAEIRIFGREGDFLRAFGGTGEGPGEFLDPRLAGRLGDTLVVYDVRLRRLTRVHPDRGPGATTEIPAEGGGFPIPRGVFADGAVAFGGGMFFSGADGLPSGVIRTPSPFRAIPADGGPAVAFGDFPGAEMYARVVDGGFTARSLPFGRVTVAAGADSLFYVGTADDWEIMAFDRSGSLARLQRLDAPRRPVTDALVDDLVEAALDRAEDDDARRELRTVYAEMPAAERVPPYDDAVVDATDHLWVRDYRLPGVERVGWTIFDPDGRAVGRLSLPARWSVLEVGPDRVLVNATDDLGVERVQVWPLRRGGR